MRWWGYAIAGAVALLGTAWIVSSQFRIWIASVTPEDKAKTNTSPGPVPITVGPPAPPTTSQPATVQVGGQTISTVNEVLGSNNAAAQIAADNNQIQQNNATIAFILSNGANFNPSVTMTFTPALGWTAAQASLWLTQLRQSNANAIAIVMSLGGVPVAQSL